MKANFKNATAGELMRLDAIAKHLELGCDPRDPAFAQEVVAACLGQVESALADSRGTTGESIVGALANRFSVQFEEVREWDDVHRLEQRYLREKRELGFGQLEMEFKNPELDALLFCRKHASPKDPDRWVAVINLIQTVARRFWTRVHELTHRIAEPPQLLLPFKRSQAKAKDAVEQLIDFVTGHIAFYQPVFGKMVRSLSSQNRLVFPVIESLRSEYEPSASIQAVMNAAVRDWPRPAMCLTGAIRGRRGVPARDVALRVEVQGRNQAAVDLGLFIYPNMRPPMSSPVYRSFEEEREISAVENLGTWTTSNGDSLAPAEILTSAVRRGDFVYAVMSA